MPQCIRYTEAKLCLSVFVSIDTIQGNWQIETGKQTHANTAPVYLLNSGKLTPQSILLDTGKLLPQCICYIPKQIRINSSLEISFSMSIALILEFSAIF